MKPLSNIAIKVENLSKVYQLGQIGTGTISKDIERWYARIRGKEDPFLRIGESNDQFTKSESHVVWSLKNINFEIEQGDSVGIIGRNGAGKSTLLKILSKVTSPTTGKISGKGRIASLLEVGTGFHPELSGRENIFLNGAILGMRRKEIQRKLEEIVAFAGIERYLDTPVKRYSSGMYVRLAFAVAAHLESEILIVDEVLAVGDMDFQKKCLGKMKDVSKGEGRTVIFVSHNMGAIKSLCQRVISLRSGQTAYQGDTVNGIADYLKFSDEVNSKYTSSVTRENGFSEIMIVDKLLASRSSFGFEDEVSVYLKYFITDEYRSALISVRFTDSLDRIVFTSETKNKKTNAYSEVTNILLTIPKRTLLPGTYRMTIAMHLPNIILVDELVDILSFTILETGSPFYHYNGTDFGCVNINCNWKSL